MGIDFFNKSDSSAFLSLAGAEGWICDQWELDFLLDTFATGCFVWREQGRPIAFITTASYGMSGWIGNLIVTPHFRGKGIGSRLITLSLSVLDEGGAETVWLTASPQGAPLYVKTGFRAQDTICRWLGNGAVNLSPSGPVCPSFVRSIDMAGWGDSRHAALAMLEGRGTMFLEADGFLLCHPSGDGIQLGPWGSRSAISATRLLERALLSGGETGPLFLDVPEQNLSASALLEAHGFVRRGSTLLMYRGRKPGFNPAIIYALASMGSFG